MAQLEHRLRLTESRVESEQPAPHRRSPRAPRQGLSCACVHNGAHGHAAEAFADAQPRAHLRDRPGRGQARLRLLLRAPPPDRPAALGLEGRPRRERPFAPRRAPAGDVRRARPDLRQVRPAALDAAGRRAAGHHRRAAEAPGRRHAVPLRAGRAGRPGRARPPDREAVRRVLRAADRRRLDRPGARRDPSQRQPCRGQGAAAERAQADRRRHPAALPGGEDHEGARARPRFRRRARPRGRVRHARSGRSSTTATRRETRRRSAATSPATRTSRSRR